MGEINDGAGPVCDRVEMAVVSAGEERDVWGTEARRVDNFE